MSDRKPFIPHVPEKNVWCEITAKEAIMLQGLREVHFGKITIHKVNGIVTRIEPQKSTIITGDEEITLPTRQ